jgi:hypothetical protein
MHGSLNEPYFQVGVLVTDLPAAMEELGASLGVDWVGPQPREIGEWTLQVAFTTQGPPYIELIQGPAGSYWDARGQGSFLHHVGYWSDDMAADAARLEAAGMPLEFDGAPHGAGIRYHRGAASGLVVELIDAANRAAWHERWGLVDVGAAN